MPAEPQEEPAEVVDGQVVPDPATEPAPALREPVADALQNADLVVADPRDENAVYVAMDAHDAVRLVERLTEQAQEQNLGKRWIYEFKSGNEWQRGLTVDAVEDIVQQMNWTGKCAIGVIPETAVFELIEGEDDEKEWTVTIAAEDARTGSRLLGTSQEPQRMKLKSGARKFDKFARGKALSKAQRNAMESFIPEKVKLTLIAMAAGNPQLVERIESAEEAKARELPAPLDTPEAKAAIEELRAIYTEIRNLGGGQGAIKLTPGQFGAYLLQSQHDLALLGNMRDWLLGRKTKIEDELKGAS